MISKMAGVWTSPTATKTGAKRAIKKKPAFTVKGVWIRGKNSIPLSETTTPRRSRIKVLPDKGQI
jgi:hypothetical protein